MNVPPTGSKTSMVRIANVLVILALVAMLIGAVVLLLARDHGVAGLPADQEAVVLDRNVQAWRMWGENLEVRLTTNTTAEVSVTFQETSGTGRHTENRTRMETGFAYVFTQSAAPGEAWVVTIQNHGEGPIRAAATATSRDHQWTGGALVGFGVLGFVFHRIGMRHAE